MASAESWLRDRSTGGIAPALYLSERYAVRMTTQQSAESVQKQMLRPVNRVAGCRSGITRRMNERHNNKDGHRQCKDHRVPKRKANWLLWHAHLPAPEPTLLSQTLDWKARDMYELPHSRAPR